MSPLRVSPRFLVLLVLLTLASVGMAQRVQAVPRNSADFKAIIRLVTQRVQRYTAFPVRVPGDKVRRAGSWVMLRSSLRAVNPRNEGDGDVIALLRREGGRWRIKELEVGSGGLEELIAGWTRQYRLPRGLAPK